MTQPIRVICDRCGGAGVAGQGEFAALGNLLEFTVVPRKFKRKDGWTAVLQREFIARLAMTGSPTLAVEAMGKCLHGVRKLLNDPGSDSFRAAWERAVEIGEGVEARRRISAQAGIQQRSAHLTGGSRRGWQPPPEPEVEQESPELRLEGLERLIAKWQRKVGQERTARLAGEIVAADFYLRQVTILEVTYDLMMEGKGSDFFEMVKELRRDGRNMLEIADTRMARILDQARRDHWKAMDEPDRPLLWPERYIIGDIGLDGDRTEPLESLGKCTTPAAGVDPEAWRQMNTDEQRRIYAAQHAADAAEQIAWEAKASAEAAEWRAREEAKRKESKT